MVRICEREKRKKGERERLGVRKRELGAVVEAAGKQ